MVGPGERPAVGLWVKPPTCLLLWAPSRPASDFSVFPPHGSAVHNTPPPPRGGLYAEPQIRAEPAPVLPRARDPGRRPVGPGPDERRDGDTRESGRRVSERWDQGRHRTDVGGHER